MKVSFEGIGECVVTFYNKEENGAVPGAPVKMTGNGEVGSCVSGDRFIGVALNGEGDFCAVQTKGFVRLPYSATAPAAGYAKLVSDGSGGVKTDNVNGGEVLVLDVDAVNKTIGVML